LEAKFTVLAGSRLPGLDLYVRQSLAEKVGRPMQGQAVDKIKRFFGVGDSRTQSSPQALVEQFRQDLCAYLQLERMDAAMREELERIGNFAVAQGAQIAVGHEMQQVLIRAAGAYETQPLKARIAPPDIRDIVLALPPFDVPVRSLENIFGVLSTV